MDTTDEWIRDRTGIERRHIAADGQTTVDLAEQAARRAIEAAGLRPEDIDFIAFGTTTPGSGVPQLRRAAAGAAGLPRRCRPSVWRPPARVFSMHCRSPTSSSRRAKRAARSSSAPRRSRASRIGVIARTAVIFADGAGAVVLQAGFKSRESFDPSACRRRLTKICSTAGPGCPRDFGDAQAAHDHHDGGQRGLQDRRDQSRQGGGGGAAGAEDWTTRSSTGSCRIRRTSASFRRPRDDCDMPIERIIVTVQDHGNTSAASVPLALDVGVRDGRIKRGELLLLEAFGGGFTWGSALSATSGAHPVSGKYTKNQRTPRACARRYSARAFAVALTSRPTA